jgi:arsenate reductase-like glutaredoxin family protein
LREVAGAGLIERDYARKPLTAEEINAILGHEPLAALLNTRHAIYKERSFADKLPARDELIKLILDEPNLLRRPIVRCGKQVVIGFDREALTKLME